MRQNYFKKSFCILLRDQHVSNEDYGIFEMKTVIEDYHGLYLKTDVLLLGGVFEDSRKMC